MKEKFYRFMAGRYGADQFSRFLSVITLVFFVLGLILKSSLFWVLALVALVYSYVRTFSKKNRKAQSGKRKISSDQI